MKKLFTFLLAVAASVGTMFAGKVQIGDLYYNLDATNQTAEVTYKSYNYSYYNEGWNVTTANIPSSVTYNGTTYSVTSIGEWALATCSSLTAVTIPNSVTSIEGNAFSGSSSLTSINVDDNNSNYSSTDGVLFNKDKTTLIAYLGGKQGAYTIPNSVTSIGDCAFAYCYFLPSITIPNSVTSIGVGAFSSCKSLTSVTIPNSVTSIGEGAFYECTSLSSVYVESETPPIIGRDVFYYYDYNHNYNQLDVTIYVPCGTIETYRSAWYIYASRIAYSPINIETKVNNEVAGEVVAPENMCDEMIVTAIPNRGYKFTKWSDGNTDNPRSFVLQKGLSFTAIFDYVLSGKCGKDSALTWTLDTTTMALNITGIGALSENYTYAPFIQSLTIGNSVTSIGSWAFSSCKSLTSVTIPNSVTSIGDGAFSGCYSLTSVTIPNNMTSIGSKAFYGCYSLSSVTIGNSVTSIGDEAFRGCNSLKTVVLGSSVKVLETFAFAYCSSIETITCYSMRPPTVNQNALYELDYSTIVYVPADYLNTYKMHDAWGLYDVRPLGATSAETEDVKITPSENEANVTWPSVSGAASNELVIKDKNGNIVCTLIFNANGQLTSIAFNAPSRNGAPAQTQSAGFSFTITGLDSGTGYDLTLTAKDNSGNTIEETTIPFQTDYPEGIEDVQSDEVQSTKVVKDGQVLILRNGKTYTMQGQEVK